MNKKIQYATIICLAATLVSGTPTVKSVDDDRFSFDCGENEPPSGPYIDLNLNNLYEYDCKSKTLVLSSTNPDLCRVVIEDGVAKPLYGLCLVLNSVNGGYSDEYRWEGLVSLVGSYNDVHVTTFDDGNSDLVEEDCKDGPNEQECQGEWLSNSVVSFWRTMENNRYIWNDGDECYHHTSTGEIEVTGSSGTRKENAQQKVEWCKQG